MVLDMPPFLRIWNEVYLLATSSKHTTVIMLNGTQIQRHANNRVKENTKAPNIAYHVWLNLLITCQFHSLHQLYWH